MAPASRTPVVRCLALSLAAALALSAAACARPAPKEEGGPPEVTVQVTNFRFEPTQVTLKKNRPARIVVLGQSGSHTFTVPDLQIDVTVATGDQKTVDVTPTETGSFAFICRFHDSMVGTIVVTD